MKILIFRFFYLLFENLDLIEELVHQYTNKGGLVPGTYTCKTYDHIWKLKETKE